MTTITKRSVAVATAVLTSNNTVMNNGDTVTIGDKVYTFQETVGTTEGNVHTDTSAVNGMANLVKAINHSATFGTDYYCAEADPLVTAVLTTSLTITITVKAAGSVTVSTNAAPRLAWSTTTAVTTSPGDIILVGEVTDAAAVMPAQQVTVGYYTTSNPNWTRAVRASDASVTIVRNGAYSVAWTVASLVECSIVLEPTLTWTPPAVISDPDNATVVADGSHADFIALGGSELTMTYVWKESVDGVTYGSALTTTGIYDVSVPGTLTITPEQAVLTSNNTAPSDGDQVELGAKVYTFKTALTPTEGEVLIVAGDADASLLNLIRAINHTGTPDTDYKCAAANAEFTADAAVATGHKMRVAAKTAGTYDTTTPVGSTLSWTAATVTSVTGYYYRCTISDNYSTPGSVDTTAAQITVT